jgi:cellulose synthase operon protein C
VVSVRGALVWGLFLALAGYFGGAGYVWLKWQQRKYNFVTYTDLLAYPMRKDKINELRGQAVIAEGMDDIKAQDWREGVMKIRIGLERYPQDLRARLELARFFIAVRVRPKAQETLLGGLDYGWPGRFYLESAVNLANSAEDQELAIQFVDRALGLHVEGKHSAADRTWLIQQRVKALLDERRYDDAIAQLDRDGAALAYDIASEFRLLALLQSGRKAESVEFAEAWVKRSGGNAQSTRLLARAYREIGRLDDMTTTLNKLRADEAADPRTLVFAFVQTLMAGAQDRGRELIEDYIFRFGGTPANFALAAEPLAEIGRLEELEFLYAAALERGVRDPRLMAARLQSYIGARRWSEAMRQISDIRAALPSEYSERASLLDLLQYLVGAASDPADGAQSSLASYVRERQLPMSAYRQCIDVLRRMARLDTARQIVTFAEGVYPANKYLAQMRVTLDEEIVARAAAEQAARPAVVSAPAYNTPAAFYAQLEKTAQEKGTTAAISLLRELRQAAPKWLQAEEEPLGRRELDYFASENDLEALQGAVRRYLNDDRVRVQNVVAVSTRLYEAKRLDAAKLVLNELLRRPSAQVQASALMRRWFPVVAAPVESVKPAGKPAVQPKAEVAKP